MARMITSVLAPIAVALITVAWNPLVAHGKKTPAAPIAERLFDHVRHGKTVRVDCTRCHPANQDGTWAQQGKKEHARCFTCHKYSSSCPTLQEKEGRVCLTCHTKFKKSCVPAAYVRPTLGKKEFSAVYSHKLHFRPDSKTGSQCETCHGEFGAGVPTSGANATGHGVCSACHARGVSPRLNKGCVACHESGSSGQVSPVSVADPYSVRFDHKAHAAKDRAGNAKNCLGCHEGAKTATTKAVPSPSMKDCRSACHDGSKAFDALGTNCTRCHSGGQ